MYMHRVIQLLIVTSKTKDFEVTMILLIGISYNYIKTCVGPLSSDCSVTCSRMFVQFTGCEQPVQRFYWPENAIDWLR